VGEGAGREREGMRKREERKTRRGRGVGWAVVEGPRLDETFDDQQRV